MRKFDAPVHIHQSIDPLINGQMMVSQVAINFFSHII